MEDKVDRRETEANAAYLGMTSTLDDDFDRLKKTANETRVNDDLAKLKAELESDTKESK